MKPKTIIVLSVILVLCVGFIVIRKSGLFKGKPAETQAPAAKDVLAQKVGEPRKLTIAAADGTTLAFEKSGPDWRIVQPVSAKAESWKISQVADSLKDLKGDPADQIGDDVTGLDKPLWTLTLVDDKGASHVLEVGRPRPLDKSKTYVRAKGSKQVFVVSRDYADDLRRPLREYRSKGLLDLKADDVVAVKVVGKEKFELSKAKSGDWAIAYENASGKGDRDKVKDLLDKFAGLSAEKFVSDKPDNLGLYGLAGGNERLIFTVRLKGEEPPATAPASAPASVSASQPAPKPGKTVTLVVGNLVDEFAFAKLADQPTVFQVKASLLDDLQPKPLDLRDRKVLTFETEDVDRVEVKLGSAAVELKKTDSLWQMVKPTAGPANSDAVRALLTDLAALNADSFPDTFKLASFGLTKPSGSIVIYPKGKSEAITVLVGDKTGSGELTYVKAAAGAGVAGLASPKIPPAAYYDTLLIEKPTSTRVCKLSIKRPDATIELADKDGAWKQEKPVEAPLEQDAVSRVVMALERVKADKIVAVGEIPPPYADPNQQVTVTVSLRDLAKPAPATQPASAPATAPAAPATQVSGGARPALPTTSTAPATPASAPAATPAPDPTTKPATATAPAAKPVEPPKPPATRPAEATKPVEAPKAPAAATQPADAKTYVVHVTKVGDKAYAWVEGQQPLLVGEFPASLYNDLAGELRPRKVLSLAADDVDNVKITGGDGKTLEFRKDKDNWVFVTDPFIKVDPEKVKTYVKDAVEATVEKFVYNPPALQATTKVTVELKAKGQAHRIVVLEQAGPDKDTRYGSASGVKETVIFSSSTVANLSKTINDFRKTDEPKTEMTPRMPPRRMPGGMPPGMFE